MKKVCHITSAHKFDDIRIFQKECKSLSKDFEVHYVVPNSDSQVIENVQIHGVKSIVGGRTQRFVKTVQAVYTEAKKIEADIYHLHDPELLLIAMKLKRNTGAKVIFDSHEDVPKQIMDKYWIPKIFRQIISKTYENFESRICKKLDAVISVTPIICNRFSAINSEVELIANFPDLNELNVESISATNKDPRAICYVGALFPSRGIKELILALESCNACLHLAGTFMNDEFEREVKSLKGWDKVKFYGQIDRNGIKNIFEKSNLGIVTLHPTLSYMEAYPIKMFEYMAAGISFIASDFPLWRNIVTSHNCGELVDPLDVSALASIINRMLDENEKTIQQGINGKQAIEAEFNWEHEEQKLIQLYLKLLKQ